MAASAERRRWTVDLALGRRWWVLPALAVVPLTMDTLVALVRGIVVLQQPTGCGYFAEELVFEGAALASIPLASATLLTKTTDVPQRVTAVSLILLGGWMFGNLFGYAFSAALLGVQTLAQLFVTRISGIGHLQASPRLQDHQGVSIRFHLGVTAAVAVTVAAVARIFDPLGLEIMLGLGGWTLLFSCAGQLLASVRGGLLSAVCGLACLIFVVWVYQIRDAPWNRFLSVTADSTVTWGDALMFSSSFAAAWAICYFHRCDRGRRTVPTIGGQPAVAAGPLE